MRLLLLTSGSRGDVQPFVALGKALKATGYDVALCTHQGFEPIVLERGVTFDVAFHDWANEVYSPEGLGGVSLLNFRKDILVTLMNLQGVAVRSYKVYRCWPSAYTALPELSGNDNAVAIQMLTLQNEGWELDEAVVETAEF